MGLLKIDEDSYVTDFQEKPEDDITLKRFLLDDRFLLSKNISSDKDHYLGSMGIYIFKRDVLLSLLKEDTRSDFGKHLIPTQLNKGKTASYIYDGYWEDIGTIKSYYDANLSLINSTTGLKTYNEDQPIYSRSHHLPGSKLHGTILRDAIICEGCIIEAKEIVNSIVGLRVNIKKGTIIHDSILNGNNYYFAPPHQTSHMPEKFSIGENCVIKKAIIDEHVLIGNNVKLINKNNYTNYDGDGIYVRDGIIIVTSNAQIPDNFEF